MEKQVTRYRLEGEPQEAEMVERPDGSFVEYEDYGELILEIKALEDELQGLRNSGTNVDCIEAATATN